MQSVNRRQLLSGMAAGATLTLGGAPRVLAAPVPISLSVVRRTIEVNKRSASVYGILQPDGRHGIDMESGSGFFVSLRNAAPEPTIMHWHGLTPPWRQDGVAGLTGELVPAGATVMYDFPLDASEAGTHWMHSHTLQEQGLLAAPLIVRAPSEDRQDVQEVVLMLHDFTFSLPEEILARLKGTTGGGALHKMGEMSSGDVGSMNKADVPQGAASPAWP